MRDLPRARRRRRGARRRAGCARSPGSSTATRTRRSAATASRSSRSAPAARATRSCTRRAAGSSPRCARRAPPARTACARRSSVTAAGCCAHGTTTFEAKSGYGLDRETELASLRAIRAAGGVPTWLGAHAVPPEFADADAYLDFALAEVLPEAARARRGRGRLPRARRVRRRAGAPLPRGVPRRRARAPPARRPVHRDRARSRSRSSSARAPSTTSRRPAPRASARSRRATSRACSCRRARSSSTGRCRRRARSSTRARRSRSRPTSTRAARSARACRSSARSLHAAPALAGGGARRRARSTRRTCSAAPTGSAASRPATAPTSSLLDAPDWRYLAYHLGGRGRRGRRASAASYAVLAAHADAEAAAGAPQKERRHEYETVWVDAEGNELEEPPDDGRRHARRARQRTGAKPKPQRRVAQPARRPRGPRRRRHRPGSAPPARAACIGAFIFVALLPRRARRAAATAFSARSRSPRSTRRSSSRSRTASTATLPPLERKMAEQPKKRDGCGPRRTASRSRPADAVDRLTRLAAMPLVVDRYALGPLQTNCYVVRTDRGAAEAAVVDPGGDAATLRLELARLGAALRRDPRHARPLRPHRRRRRPRRGHRAPRSGCRRASGSGSSGSPSSRRSALPGRAARARAPRLRRRDDRGRGNLVRVPRRPRPLARARRVLRRRRALQRRPALRRLRRPRRPPRRRLGHAARLGAHARGPLPAGDGRPPRHGPETTLGVELARNPFLAELRARGMSRSSRRRGDARRPAGRPPLVARRPDDRGAVARSTASRRIQTPGLRGHGALRAHVRRRRPTSCTRRCTRSSDRGDRSLTLRPEGTAPIARAYIEHGLHREPQPREGVHDRADVPLRPRRGRGRYREHWQLSVEAIGSADPAIDAEMIQLYAELLRRLGVTEWRARSSTRSATRTAGRSTSRGSTSGSTRTPSVARRGRRATSARRAPAGLRREEREGARGARRRAEDRRLALRRVPRALRRGAGAPRRATGSATRSTRRSCAASTTTRARRSSSSGRRRTSTRRSAAAAATTASSRRSAARRRRASASAPGSSGSCSRSSARASTAEAPRLDLFVAFEEPALRAPCPPADRRAESRGPRPSTPTTLAAR